MGIIASLDIDTQKGFTPLPERGCPSLAGYHSGGAQCPAALATLREPAAGCPPARTPLGEVTEPSHVAALCLANADLTWPAHCVPGTPGFELLDGLPAPIDYDFRLEGVQPDLASLWRLLSRPGGASQHRLSSFCKPAASLPCWSAASPPTTASKPACCNCVAPVSGSSSTSTPAAASPPTSTRPVPR